MDNPNIITSITSSKFECIKCDFKCSKKGDWGRHILTLKHTILTNPNDNPNIITSPTTFSCICSNKYKHLSSLCAHKKKCIKLIIEEKNVFKDLEEEFDNEDIKGCIKKGITNIDPQMLLEVLKQNQEFQMFMMEQHKQMMELAKSFNSINNNNNTTNNVNSNNNTNTFNLQLFLNDTCKGAMNMSEFVDTIAIQMCDLENFAHMDYADGVSKILLKNLNNLDTNQRPIHCTDLKRETVYIKENNCWTKETDDKTNLKSAIKKIANKNIRQINEWVKEHPGCRDPTTKQNVKYNKIVMNSMSGGTVQEQQDNIEKIVKNVTKSVTIDKCALK
jgi:hypothetical protein